MERLDGIIAKRLGGTGAKMAKRNRRRLRRKRAAAPADGTIARDEREGLTAAGADRSVEDQKR